MPAFLPPPRLPAHLELLPTARMPRCYSSAFTYFDLTDQQSGSRRRIDPSLPVDLGRMRFGFGVGDFLAVIELATKIQKEIAGAPSQYKALSDEVKNGRTRNGGRDRTKSSVWVSVPKGVAPCPQVIF